MGTLELILHLKCRMSDGGLVRSEFLTGLPENLEEDAPHWCYDDATVTPKAPAPKRVAPKQPPRTPMTPSSSPRSDLESASAYHAYLPPKQKTSPPSIGPAPYGDMRMKEPKAPAQKPRASEFTAKRSAPQGSEPPGKRYKGAKSPQESPRSNESDTNPWVGIGGEQGALKGESAPETPWNSPARPNTPDPWEAPYDDWGSWGHAAPEGAAAADDSTFARASWSPAQATQPWEPTLPSASSTPTGKGTSRGPYARDWPPPSAGRGKGYSAWSRWRPQGGSRCTPRRAAPSTAAPPR